MDINQTLQKKLNFKHLKNDKKLQIFTWIKSFHSQESKVTYLTWSTSTRGTFKGIVWHFKEYV